MVARCVAFLALFLAVAQTCSAAVAFRGSTCNTLNVGTSITLTAPVATQTGDLLIAMVVSDDGHSTTSSPSPTTGWTQIATWLPGGLSSGAVWYRFATANGATAYTFSLNAGQGNSGTLIAYSGTDPAAPIVGSMPTSNTSTGTGTNVALPNATAGRAGSLRVSLVQRIADTTSTYSGGMAETCDQGINFGGAFTTSVSSAYESQGVGTTATRTATLAASAQWQAITLVLQPVIPCSTGGVAFSAPSGVTFPATTLNGLDQTQNAVANFTIDDEVAAHPGWNLSGTSTTFIAGAHSLLDTATTLIGASPTAAGGNCSLPTSSIGYPVPFPAGPTAPTAAKLINAAANTGAGPLSIDLAFALALPAATHVGTYSSTWTFTLATGP